MVGKTSVWKAIGIVFGGALAIATITILIIVSLTIMLPNSVMRDNYFNSVEKLSSLSLQIQDTKSLQNQMASDIKKLNDVSINLKNSKPKQPQLNITSIDGASKTLEETKKKLISIDSKQDELKNTIDTLIKDSKEVDKILNTMPLVNGEWISHLVIGVLWICLCTVLLIYLFISPAALRVVSFFLSIFRSFKGFGFELSVSEQRTREEEMHKTFKQVFSELRDQIKHEMRRFSKSSGLQSRFRIAVNKIFEEIRSLTDNNDLGDLRCTIHMPDVLFTQFLCQVIDYEPKGKGSGRAWSEFYGIIGRAWRSEDNDFLQLERSILEDKLKAKEIMKQYGMTEHQINNTINTKMSFMAIPIKDDGGTKFGVFYMDSTKQGIFGEDINVPRLMDSITPHLNPLKRFLLRYDKDYPEAIVQVNGT